MEEEDRFLRPWIIRLRGILPFSNGKPELEAVLREIIASAEERLAALDDAKLRDSRGGA